MQRKKVKIWCKDPYFSLQSKKIKQAQKNAYIYSKKYGTVKRIKYSKVRKVQPYNFEYTGEYTADPVEMQLFVFDEEGYEEYRNVSLDRVITECRDELQVNDVKWLNVHGLHDVELVKKITELYVFL